MRKTEKGLTASLLLEVGNSERKIDHLNFSPMQNSKDNKSPSQHRKVPSPKHFN